MNKDLRDKIDALEEAAKDLVRAMERGIGNEPDKAGWCLNAARAELFSCIEATLAAIAWQPIETAPKDGRSVDLWVIHLASGEGYRATDCFYVQVDNKWCHRGYGYFDKGNRPTHWKPLGEPPEAA